MAYREPKCDEKRLLSALALAAPEVGNGVSWTEGVTVEDMPDGGMGSLRLSMSGVPVLDRRFRRVASEVSFVDRDGVLVIASLYVDSDDVPFELDVWKTTFEPLLQIPEPFPWRLDPATNRGGTFDDARERGIFWQRPDYRYGFPSERADSRHLAPLRRCQRADPASNVTLSRGRECSEPSGWGPGPSIAYQNVAGKCPG